MLLLPIYSLFQGDNINTEIALTKFTMVSGNIKQQKYQTGIHILYYNFTYYQSNLSHKVFYFRVAYMQRALSSTAIHQNLVKIPPQNTLKNDTPYDICKITLQ